MTRKKAKRRKMSPKIIVNKLIFIEISALKVKTLIHQTYVINTAKLNNEDLIKFQPNGDK